MTKSTKNRRCQGFRAPPAAIAEDASAFAAGAWFIVAGASAVISGAWFVAAGASADAADAWFVVADASAVISDASAVVAVGAIIPLNCVFSTANRKLPRGARRATIYALKRGI